MPFYKKKITYDEIAPHIQKFRTWMRNNCPVIQEYAEDLDITEAFLIGPEQRPEYHRNIKILSFLFESKFVQVVPLEDDCGIFYWYKVADGQQQTISPTHLRLPKLSHLITLTPIDFFTLLRLISTSKKTPAGDSISLNVAAAGIQSLEKSCLNQFFTKLRTNYRVNPDYADRKWTDRTAIDHVARLSPNRENQLMAMQFLTAIQNNDLLYFPLETSLDLELDWEQMDNDYCIPCSNKED